MKILFVTARLPYPPIKGDKAIPFYRLRELSRRHDVYLVSFVENDDDKRNVSRLRDFCREVTVVPRSRAGALIGLASTAFSATPFQVGYFRSRRMQRAVQEAIARIQPDVLDVFTVRMAQYGLTHRGARVLDLIDSMALNFRRRVEQTTTYPMRLLLRNELQRVERYERVAVREYNRAIVVADADRETVGADLDVVPLGVDIPASPRGDYLPNRVIFSGNMGYHPNRAAVDWFIEKVLPRLRADLPDVEFVIAGANPPRDLSGMQASHGVVVTGFVEDLGAEIAQSAVSVAPMQSGSGMQFKILEALAQGVPVIATSLGAGSIPSGESNGIVVADKAQSFADACLSLTQDADRRNRIGTDGRKLAAERYSWAAHARKVEILYEELIAGD